MRLKHSILLFFLACSCSLMSRAQSVLREALQSGDLIFQDLDGGPLSDAIESVTPHYKGHAFSHVGILYIKENRIFVIEAIGKKVQLNPLNTVLRRSPHPSYIGRLKPSYQSLRKKIIDFALRQLGKPYDDDFLMNNGKYYCSELVYAAFKAANEGKAVFELFPMTYKKPGSDVYFPAWKTYFKEKGEPVPEGLPGCNPGGIAVSGKLTLTVLK